MKAENCKLVFIPGNVPSSKNSKIKTSRGIFNSKAVSKYLQFIGVKRYSAKKREVENYKTRPNKFFTAIHESGVFYGRNILNSEQVKFGFHFVRKTRRKFDFHNMVQIIADLLVAHTFILDDDITHFLPYPMEMDGKYYSHDKENPGVWIGIE